MVPPKRWLRYADGKTGVWSTTSFPRSRAATKLDSEIAISDEVCLIMRYDFSGRSRNNAKTRTICIGRLHL